MSRIPTTRNIPVEKVTTALLIIDMQEYCGRAGSGLFSHVDPNNITDEHQYLFSRLKNTTIPSIQSLLAAFRAKKGEIIYTFIESLTKDCRDQSLDYKLSGFGVPKGHPDAKILKELAPGPDEIQIPKTSCSVFMSTNIEYVLRNLGVTQLVMTGMLTNQCVESAVRDAADRGFLLTVPEDACATHCQMDHDQSLKNMRGFSRVCQTSQVIEEVQAWEC